MKRGKFEPLEGKVYHIVEKGINIFLFSDVKSAVQGLLEEIDSSYGCIHHKEEGGDDECIICVAIGQTLNEVKRKIKKWFPDVFKEEVNENDKE